MSPTHSYCFCPHLGNVSILPNTDVKHGCLSPRRFYNALSAVYNKFNEKNISKPPVSLHGQLMWREYNYLMCYTTPNCHTTLGNPIARRMYQYLARYVYSNLYLLRKSLTVSQRFWFV